MSARLVTRMMLGWAATLGCTGAIPEPLELGALVGVGGWLAVRTSGGEVSLLQRLDDQDGAPRFRAVGGEASGALNLSDARELSVWALEPEQVVLFDPQGVRRAPRPEELELVAPEAALGACACPIPRLGGVVRLLSGASCALPPTDARTHRWNGEAWEQSDGAPEAVALHVGGERCLPSPEEMIANAFTRVEVVETIELPDDSERVGGYQAFEILEDGSFYAMGEFGAAHLKTGEGPAVRAYVRRRSGEVAPPSRWPIRATLRVRGSRVIGVVGHVTDGLKDAVRVFVGGDPQMEEGGTPPSLFPGEPPDFGRMMSEAERAWIVHMGERAALLAMSGRRGPELGEFSTANLAPDAETVPQLRAGSALACDVVVWGSSERPCPDSGACPGAHPSAPRRAFVLDTGWVEAFEAQDGPAWPSSWWTARLSCVRPDLVVEWTGSSTRSVEGADMWVLRPTGAGGTPRWQMARSFALQTSSCGAYVPRVHAAPSREGFFMLLEDGRVLAPDGGCTASPSIEGPLVSWRPSAPEGAPWFLSGGGRLSRLAGSISSESPP